MLFDELGILFSISLSFEDDLVMKYLTRGNMDMRKPRRNEFCVVFVFGFVFIVDMHMCCGWKGRWLSE